MVDFFICPEYNLNFLFDHLNVILDDKLSSDICFQILTLQGKVFCSFARNVFHNEIQLATYKM